MTGTHTIRCSTTIQSRGVVLFLLTAVILGAPAGAAGANTVTLNWSAPGDDGDSGTASAYDIRYSTATIAEANWAAAMQATGEPSPQTAGSAESYTVTNLSPSTTYYFAIKASDEVGNWSALSNVVSAITDAEQDAPAALDDLAAANPTDSSIALTWTATGDDGTSGTASEYDIRYSSSPINISNWNSATQVQNEPAPQPTGSQESFTVYGLNENSTYYFAVKVADEVPNWSGLSNVASGVTETEAVAPAALDDLVALNATGTTVDLVWTATGDDGTIGTATFYDIRFSTSTITEANWDNATHVTSEPSPQQSGEIESFTISGLEESTSYYIAIKVGDEVPNWSGLSNVATATTSDQTPPVAITDLQASP